MKPDTLFFASAVAFLASAYATTIQTVWGG